MAPSGDPGSAATMRVVAAAIVRDGRLLAARRSAPSRLAGGWEFPGGKVEPGEDDTQALIRECREELGVGVTVGPRLAEATDAQLHIVLYAASLDDAQPRPLEDQDELRWLSPEELTSVGWLPIDRDLLPGAAAYVREPNRWASM